MKNVAVKLGQTKLQYKIYTINYKLQLNLRNSENVTMRTIYFLSKLKLGEIL